MGVSGFDSASSRTPWLPTVDVSEVRHSASEKTPVLSLSMKSFSLP